MNNWKTLSLQFDERNLEILDQQLLPREEHWVKIRHPEDMVSAIQMLKVRGAPLIGVAAALCLGQFYNSGVARHEWFQWAQKIREARPTAVNLMWATDRVKNKVEAGHDPQTVWREAVKIFEEDVELCQRIARNGAELIPQQARVLTHCNTGGLATAGVGTALGVIAQAHQQGKDLHVYVDETRPLLQGGRLTTYELQKLGIPYTLISDNMAGMLMSQNKVDAVIVGSDRIARNGDFANKIGTYSLAVLCKYHAIPFYVAAPQTTVDLECSGGEKIPIEERPPQEVRGYAERQWAPSECGVYNPAFDVTPASLVSAWILDSGVYRPEDFSSGKFVEAILSAQKEG